MLSASLNRTFPCFLQSDNLSLREFIIQGSYKTVDEVCVCVGGGGGGGGSENRVHAPREIKH